MAREARHQQAGAGPDADQSQGGWGGQKGVVKGGWSKQRTTRCLVEREVEPGAVQGGGQNNAPLLDVVERADSGEVKHEQDGRRVVADQWQHVDELPLPP